MTTERAIPPSPTWENLKAGIFTIPVVTAVPAGDGWPDGTAVLYSTGASLTLYCYTRASGWLSEALS